MTARRELASLALGWLVAVAIGCAEPVRDDAPAASPEPRAVAAMAATTSAPRDEARPARPAKPPRARPRRAQRTDEREPTAVGARQRGVAVWYGAAAHGKRTASGERFDRDGLTAAHRTLPMGASVRVTNQRNQASVTVRINDRGPFGKRRDRIIDVSEAAARTLGMIDAGSCLVELEVLTLPAAPAPAAPAPPASAAKPVEPAGPAKPAEPAKKKESRS